MSDIENIKGRMRAAFATTPLTDDKWQAVLDILHANGYRRCAEGQRTTQWCGEVERLRHDIERHMQRCLQVVREHLEAQQARPDRYVESLYVGCVEGSRPRRM